MNGHGQTERGEGENVQKVEKDILAKFGTQFITRNLLNTS